MPETLLYGCRVYLAAGFVYRTVRLLPGGVTGSVTLHGEEVRVYVVDGSKQYAWATSKQDASYYAARDYGVRYRETCSDCGKVVDKPVYGPKHEETVTPVARCQPCHNKQVRRWERLYR